MNHAPILTRGGAAELTDEVRTHLRQSVAEFTRLLAEWDAPQSSSAGQHTATAKSTQPSSALALPPAIAGENAEEYVRDRLIPHIEQTLIPRLRARIAERHARTETGRRLEREVQQLRLEVTVAEGQAGANTAATRAHRWHPHLLH